MNVGQLKIALKKVDDNTEVVITDLYRQKEEKIRSAELVKFCSQTERYEQFIIYKAPDQTKRRKP